MADGVGQHVLHVHQTLHGYADGHRLIGASLQLSASDAKQMLVLSDLAGAGGKLDDRGYLTGYPLPELGMYAVARTWPAPEMPRPGCVWTHTILVDYSDLALLRAPASIARLFRRPRNDLGEYAIPIAFADGEPDALDESLRPLASRLLYSLYSLAPSRLVGPATSDEAIERVMLTLWAQQWPRLRRAFRFCTSTTIDRSTDVYAFDLQFYPAHERSARTRFPSCVDIVEPESEQQTGWLAHTLDDLCAPEKHRLRDFLRQVGGEVQTGREAFSVLAELHRHLAMSEQQPTAMAEAISIARTSSVPWPTAKIAVVITALRHAESLSTGAISFVLDHLDAMEPASAKTYAAKLTRSLLKNAPQSFSLALAGDGIANEAARETLSTASDSELVAALRVAPALSSSVLRSRPDVVEKSEYWKLDDPCLDAGLDHLRRHPDQIAPAFVAIVASSRGDLAGFVTKRLGASPVLSAVGRCLRSISSDKSMEPFHPWLEASGRDAQALARALSEKAFPHAGALALIARVTHPDHVPNDYGEDPWWTSFSVATQDGVSDYNALYLSAYLFGRALGYRSRSQAELLAATFDAVHTAAAKPEMPEDAWQLVSPRTPTVYGRPSWDKCVRLRAAAIDAFVGRDLWPLKFGQLTTNDAIFDELLDAVADSYRGRRYLRRVQKELSDLDRRRYTHRVSRIEDVLH